MEDLRNLLKPGDMVKLKNVADMVESAGSSQTLGALDDQSVIDEYMEYSEMVGTVRSVRETNFTLNEAGTVVFFGGDIAMWPREFEMGEVNVNDMLEFLGICEV